MINFGLCLSVLSSYYFNIIYWQ